MLKPVSSGRNFALGEDFFFVLQFLGCMELIRQDKEGPV
jgi:hypothetical protein